MASSDFNLPYTPLDITLPNTSDVATTIVNGWDSLPHGKPFFGILRSNGYRFIQGYIYENGQYGEVTTFSFEESRIYLIRRNNGTFVKRYVDFNGTLT